MDDWVDVTAALRAATGSLANGEMVHSERFSLNHSLTAYELMDPKMDGGCSRETIPTIKKLLDAGAVKIDLSAGECVGLMDLVMACEGTWVDTGATLGHTVFTCVYLHDIQGTVKSPVLRVFLQCMLKTVELVYDTIKLVRVCVCVVCIYMCVCVCCVCPCHANCTHLYKYAYPTHRATSTGPNSVLITSQT
jgi:hypothetical protein